MKKAIVLAIIGLLLSCSAPNDNIARYVLDIDKSKNFIPGNEVLDSVDFSCICLENDKCMISRIEDMKFCDGVIYILDENRHNLYGFNEKGKCISVLSKAGNSSKEYIEITDFFVCEDKIYVLDNYSRKIVIYNSNGEFNTRIDISAYWANQLIVMNDFMYLINEGSDCDEGQYHVFKIDFNGGLVERFLQFDKAPGLVARNLCSMNTQSFLYVDRENNNIYKFDDKGCEAIAAFDYGSYNLPEKLFGKNAMELMDEGSYKSYSLGIEEIKSNERTIWGRFSAGDNSYLFVYDYKKGKINWLCRGVLLDNLYNVGLSNCYICGDYVYDVYYADQLLPLIELNEERGVVYNKQCAKDIHEIKNTVREDSNPVIFKYKLKYDKSPS